MQSLPLHYRARYSKAKILLQFPYYSNTFFPLLFETSNVVMASMVKKFRLAWISVSWRWMEEKHYFSKYMNPYAHTHLHAPRPRSCNRICSCIGLCPSGAVLNANQAHLTAQALVTQHFGNAATNVIQENSSVVQTKLGNGPSIVANKIKLIESQMMLQGLCAHPSVHLQPGGGKCGFCSSLQGRSDGRRDPRAHPAAALSKQAVLPPWYNGTEKQLLPWFCSPLGFIPSAYVRWERVGGHRDQYWIFGEVLVLLFSPWAQFCALRTACTPQPLPWGTDQGTWMGLSHLSEDQCRNPALLDDFLRHQGTWCCLCHQNI